MANKIYAVKKGLVPGLYNSWDECKAQVNGYSGAEYKSFKISQISEAIEYVGIANMQIESNINAKRFIEPESLDKHTLKVLDRIDPGFSPAHATAYTMSSIASVILKKSDEFKDFAQNEIANLNNSIDIYTDGSFKNGKYSYAFVAVKDNQIIYTDSGVGKDEGAATTNNIAGELSAAMHAICWARDNNYTCRIFHDYEGVGKWATKEWKRKNKYTKAYSEFIDSNPGIVSEFIHVYGHKGNTYNELADQLAGEAFEKEI
jgi:ribonuclease HI|nr:MAG TPA: RNAseH-like protein [Caudoviricetes sp.]